jgi:hypothetical protein
MIDGRCLCGKAGYSITGDIGQVTHCHCAMCRKVHGAAFGTYATVQRSDFQWTSGGDLVVPYRSSEGVDRLFCRECGSTLQVRYKSEPDVLYVTMGTIEGDPGCRPEAHIFAGSIAPWYEIADDLPQFDTWTDQYGGAG